MTTRKQVQESKIIFASSQAGATTRLQLNAGHLSSKRLIKVSYSWIRVPFFRNAAFNEVRKRERNRWIH